MDQTAARGRFSSTPHVGLCLSLFGLLELAGCTKERQQPVLTIQAPAVSNSLRAPVPRDPKLKQGRVELPEKSWGARRREDGVGQPLTSADKNVLAAQARSLNDHPEGLQRKDLQAALDAQMGNLARCFDNVDVTNVGVFFEADPTGEARGIRVRGAPPAAETCVSGLIGALKFPPFKGNPVPVDFPLSVRQRVVTANKNEAPQPDGERP